MDPDLVPAQISAARDGSLWATDPEGTVVRYAVETQSWQKVPKFVDLARRLRRS
jgi:hypothetical protein